MRIIAGEFRGRRLLPPEGTDVTRPITDRVKQSLFDILAPEIPGATVFDCFAGTGSLGLECVSRGAESVLLFERDRSAAGRLKRNIQTLGVKNALVLEGDVFQLVGTLVEREGASPRNVGLVFLDPPYRFVRERPDKLVTLGRQLVTRFLAPGGVIVFRHDAKDRLEFPGVTTTDQRTYGGMTLEFLRAPAPPRAPPPEGGDSVAGNEVNP
jgi:16S rRNA (guanine966-N2)-methyltransferase